MGDFEPTTPIDVAAHPGSRAERIVAPYYLRLAVFGDGERFPYLFARGSASPLPDVTLYSTLHLRPGSNAYRTISRNLTAVQFLLCFAWSEGIDLRSRIAKATFLSLAELEHLVLAARRPLHDILAHHAKCVATPARPKVVSLERVRSGAPKNAVFVAPSTADNRLFYSAKFLDWLSDQRADELRLAPRRLEEFTTRRVVFFDQLYARIEAYRHSRRRRESPPAEVIESMLEASRPESSRNPWPSKAARERNHLLVQWLIAFGIRVGELLNVRIQDVQTGLGEVHIVRRQDSPEDPRRAQPCVKTFGRILPILDLGPLCQHFILETRRAILGATRHPFLFVDVRSGRPLSVAAAEKVLRELGNCVGCHLTPHLLRHAWNDRFSKHCREMGIPKEEEEQLRSYLMGWSDRSVAAADYTERYVREQSAVVLKDMNQRLLQGRNLL